MRDWSQGQGRGKASEGWFPPWASGPSPAGEASETLTESSSELTSSDRRLGQLPTTSRPPWLQGYPAHHTTGSSQGPRDRPAHLCRADKATEVRKRGGGRLKASASFLQRQMQAPSCGQAALGLS